MEGVGEMNVKVSRPISIFYSSAHQDKKFLDAIEKYLNPLGRQGKITTWHSQKILPGTEWANTIDVQLETADIILLLISPDFLSSDYCTSEMRKALKKRVDVTSFLFYFDPSITKVHQSVISRCFHVGGSP